jgi:hypothetical protein
MSRNIEKVACGASRRDFIFANFAGKSFSTPTPVNSQLLSDFHVPCRQLAGCLPCPLGFVRALLKYVVSEFAVRGLDNH